MTRITRHWKPLSYVSTSCHVSTRNSIRRGGGGGGSLSHGWCGVRAARRIHVAIEKEKVKAPGTCAMRKGDENGGGCIAIFGGICVDYIGSFVI